MKLIDDKAAVRLLQRLVAVPCVVLIDDLAPVLERIVGTHLPAPDRSAGNGFCIGIQHNAIAVEAESFFRIIGAVEAVAIFGDLEIQPEDHDRIDIADAVFLRHRNLGERLVLAVVIQHQRTARCLLGIDAEIDTAVDERRTERKNVSDAVSEILKALCREFVHESHAKCPLSGMRLSAACISIITHSP